MSRFKPRELNRRYKPGLQIWTRTAEEGGEVAPEASSRPSPPRHGYRQITVLVHGYNNHFGEACDAYQHGFRRCQLWFTRNLTRKHIETLLGDVHWPGDAKWWGVLDRLDFLIYSDAVRRTPVVGERIAEFLAGLPNLQTVNFVGHSLGCRVILETIRSLPRRVQIGRVVLMAAAVPRYMVYSDSGRLFGALKRAGSILVLWSSADRTLDIPFRMGQSAAGEQGPGWAGLPSAVGRTTPDLHRFPQMKGRRISGAKHSDYWGHTDTPPSWIAAFRTGRFLRLGSMPRSVGR